MANKLYEESSVQAIADAIRAKNGSSDTYTIGQMASAVSNLPSGGGVRTDLIVVGSSAAGFTEADCDYLCDGVADDAQINDAIGAARTRKSGYSNSRPTSKVVLLPGIYRISSPITITDGVELCGIQRSGGGTFSSVYIQPESSYEAESTTSDQVVSITGEATIRNIMFYFGTMKRPILVQHLSGYVLIEDCLFWGTGTNAIRSQRTGIVINRCRFDGFGTAVYFNNSGMVLYRSSIKNSTFNYCTTRAIYITSYCDCEANYLYTDDTTNKVGIYVVGSNNVISNNMLTYNKEYEEAEGVTLDHPTISLGENAEYCVVTSNNCMGTQIINSSSATNNVIANNA